MPDRKLTVGDVAHEIGRNKQEVTAAAYELQLGLETRKPMTVTEDERDLIRDHLNKKDEKKSNAVAK